MSQLLLSLKGPLHKPFWSDCFIHKTVLQGDPIKPIIFWIINCHLQRSESSVKLQKISNIEYMYPVWENILEISILRRWLRSEYSLTIILSRLLWLVITAILIFLIFHVQKGSPPSFGGFPCVGKWTHYFLIYLHTVHYSQ